MQHGGEDLDLLHVAHITLSFDQVANFIGLEEQDERAPAKLTNVPCRADPTAKPAAPMIAMKLVVCTPSMPMKMTNKSMRRETATKLCRKRCNVGSTPRLVSTLPITFTNIFISKEPTHSTSKAATNLVA